MIRFLLSCCGGMIGYWIVYGICAFVEHLQTKRTDRELDFKSAEAFEVDIDSMSKLYVHKSSQHDFQVRVTTTSTGDVMIDIMDNTEQPGHVYLNQKEDL